jgi:hypothetical protein
MSESYEIDSQSVVLGGLFRISGPEKMLPYANISEGMRLGLWTSILDSYWPAPSLLSSVALLASRVDAPFLTALLHAGLQLL